MIKELSIFIAVLLLLSLQSNFALADDVLEFTKTKNGRYELSHKDCRIRVIPQKAQQMAAFYEARGFPADAINVLNKTCFFTMGIHNKSKEILWLDLKHWAFKNNNKSVQRLDKAYWRQHWQKLGLSKPLQATFRWTQIPESLDFYPDEHEGGNIILPRLDTTYSVTARLFSKPDRSGKTYDIKLSQLECGEM